jgi:hypothetical protein
VQYLLRSLQKFNPENRYRLKQKRNVWCLYLVDMNMKQKQTRPEFKEFQCLPDWPIIIRSSDAKQSHEHASAQKIKMSPPLLEEDRLSMRSFVE